MSGFTQWFVENVQPILNPLLPILVPLVLAYVGKVVLQVWANLPANQRALLKDIVGTGVAAVQQRYPNLSNEEKFREAEKYIQDQLSHRGINVPPSVLEPLIEEAVLGIKLVTEEAHTPSSTVGFMGSPSTVTTHAWTEPGKEGKYARG